MNRNTQEHFANIPGISIGRSKFDRSFTHKTTFSAGSLIPIFVDPDIVPGDSVTMRMSEVVRMMTPIAPVLDNCWLDTYFFFVPNRLVMNDWKKLMGENETAPWTQTEDIQIPQVEFLNSQKNGDNLTKNCRIGSIAEKMGIPPQEDWTYATPKTKSISVSMLPFRAYCLIWNEFFRDENLQNPVNIDKTNTNSSTLNKYHSAYVSDPDAATVAYEYLGGLPPLKVCKPFDYFTACLPQSQKGVAVTIPLSEDKAPLKIGQKVNGTSASHEWSDIYTDTDPAVKITGMDAALTAKNLTGYANLAGIAEDGWPEHGVSTDTVNLYTDLSAVTGATVTQLRQAFAIQKFFERDARSGTRYIESIRSHFGVQNPDYRLQRPEYLGGFRTPININQVIQSTPTENDSTPLGTTGAYSVTSDKHGDLFTKSFTEHGCLIGLCCVRTSHTYQQGINRAWFKKKRLDFYSPEFANLSEQAVMLRELYAQGTSDDNTAFGYQEAWAEMRYMPDMISGELRSVASQSLDIWHYGDYYESKPELGDKWIQETDANIQRTLAVQNHDQFMADFYFGAIYTRPMPLYSVPGLIDHH